MIDLSQPEGKTFECKRDLSSPKPLLKTILAFANTAGGRLVIGIDDDRHIVGIANALENEERLCNLIADSISPRLVPNVEMMTVDGRTLLIVEVFLSGQRPHFLNAEGMEHGVYVRLGSSNRQADRELIGELRRSAEGVAFDEMPMPALTMDDLNITEIQAAFGARRKIDEKSLTTLKLLRHDQGRCVPSIGGILLFGRERTSYFPDAWVQCGRFQGVDKAVIFDHIEIDQPLPIALESIMLFLQKHAMRGADFSQLHRKDVWSIPLVILREAVINALVHADYSQRGAPIRISFFDDRIEIENPGILLPGMTIDDMKLGISKIRNPVIVRVFRELNLVEQWGSGVKRILKEAQYLGLPEVEITEIGMRMRMVVYFKTSRTVKENTPTFDLRAQSKAQSEAQSVFILDLLFSSNMSAAELVNALRLRSKTGAFKRSIQELLMDGLIEYTIPEKINSRLQQYRITEKGRRWKSGQ